MAQKTQSTGMLYEGTPMEYPRIPTQEELDAFREELRNRTSESLSKIKSADPGFSFGMPESQRPEGAKLAEAKELPWGAKERKATVEPADKVKRFSNLPEYAEDPSVTYIEEAKKGPEMTTDPRQSPAFQMFKSALIEQIGFDPTTYNPYQVAMDAVGGDPELDPQRFKTVYENAKMKKESAMDVWDYSMSQFDKEEAKRLSREREMKTQQASQQKEQQKKEEAKGRDFRTLSDKNIKLSGDMNKLRDEMQEEADFNGADSQLYKNMEQQMKLMQEQFDLNNAEIEKLRPKKTPPGKDINKPVDPASLKTKEEVVGALKKKQINEQQARIRLAELLPEIFKKIREGKAEKAKTEKKGDVTVTPVAAKNPELEAASKKISEGVSAQLESKFELSKPQKAAEESDVGMPIPSFYRNMKK